MDKGNFKHGKTLIKSYCIDCKTLLNKHAFYYKNKRCGSCAQKINQKGTKNTNYKNNDIVVNCEHCNHKLLRKPKHLKNSSKFFCNFTCSGLWRKDNFKDENNSNWKNGISKLPYSCKFTKQLKEKIRKRDNHQCQRCGIEEKNHFRGNKQINLTIHHIDYDKMNCVELNLIALCNICNIKANKNRDYWFAYYTYLMEIKYQT